MPSTGSRIDRRRNALPDDRRTLCRARGHRDGSGHRSHARSPAVLGNALVNVGTLEMSLDLPRPWTHSREALTVSRGQASRAWSTSRTETTQSVLWNAGRLAESRSVLAEAQETVHRPHDSASFLLGWMPALQRQAVSRCTASFRRGLGCLMGQAGLGCLEIIAVLSIGEPERAASLTKANTRTRCGAAGLADDFMNFWPPLVSGSGGGREADLAVELLEPVTTAAPGILSPAVAAHLYNLKGVVGALRGDGLSRSKPISVPVSLR